MSSMLRRTLFILYVMKRRARKEVARLARGRVGTGNGLPNLVRKGNHFCAEYFFQPVFLPGDNADLLPPGPDQASHNQKEGEDDLEWSFCPGIDGGEGNCRLLAHW